MAIVGNGLAALLAAQLCMKEGIRAIVLNPDEDFFLEDSELGLDPFFFSEEESVEGIRARLQSSGSEDLLARLQPHFPGALAHSSADKPGASEHEFLETPVVRSRGRMWIDLRQDEAWDEFALKLEEAGSKPTWVDGLMAVRRLPGAAAPKVLGSVSRGLVLSGFGDVDLSRFRTGVHEFVADRLARQEGGPGLALGVEELSLSEQSLQWKVGRASQAFDPRALRLGVWTFLTPRIARRLKLAAAELPDVLGCRTLEEWTLLSREPIHLATIGNLRRATSDLCVWGSLDGSFPKEENVYRLNVLHQGPLLAYDAYGAPVESLNRVSELCLETLKWDAFSVRSLRSRRVFEWREGAAEFRRGNVRYVPNCDGPISGVVARVERVFESALRERAS